MDSRLCDSIIRTSYSTICKIWNRTRAHLQNSIATFNQDGCLSKIYIRDFEGLRIDETHHISIRNLEFLLNLLPLF